MKGVSRARYVHVKLELERLYCVDAECLVVDDDGTMSPSDAVRRAEVSLHGNISSTSGCLHRLEVQLGNGPEPPKERMQPEDDFYANVGDAIRTLREDVPTLFKADLNYSIYRDDIVFRDPRNCFRGMDNYKLIFWSLRFHGTLFFKDLYVEVKRIWQKTDDTICLRWTVHGFPRLPWDQEGLFDGISTYKLDSHGKIYEHKVDNVIMSDPPVQRIPLLIKLDLAPVHQPYPTPWVEPPKPRSPSDALPLGMSRPSLEC